MHRSIRRSACAASFSSLTLFGQKYTTQGLIQGYLLRIPHPKDGHYLGRNIIYTAHVSGTPSICTVNNLSGPSAEVHRLSGWQLHSSTPTSIHRSGIYLAGATIHFGLQRFVHHIQQLHSSEHLATPIHRGCSIPDAHLPYFHASRELPSWIPCGQTQHIVSH